MAKEIALLTAGHLSSCPRLIKEAELLSSSGYSISIVFLESIPRIALLDQSIIDSNKNWKFYPIKWERSLQTYLSKLAYKFSHWFKLNTDFIQSPSKALIDATLKIKADLYIAHHPTVLAAAALAAKKYNAKYVYDIEDAFPFIKDNSYINNPEQSLFNIEKKYINDAVFTTAASPLYSDLYQGIYHLEKRPIELLNVFDIVDEEVISYKDRKDLSKVSLYWYSQTVGLNRGLQDLFMAINNLPVDSFELHIRGNCEKDIKEELLSYVLNEKYLSNIYFHKTISTSELNIRNKEHDIGFAIEYSMSLNRELCISNKILDYLRSGLMVAATNTPGQKIITTELGNNCIVYDEKNIDELSQALLNVINHRDIIMNSKKRSLELAKQKYNWTLQSSELLKKIKETLN